MVCFPGQCQKARLGMDRWHSLRRHKPGCSGQITARLALGLLLSQAAPTANYGGRWFESIAAHQLVLSQPNQTREIWIVRYASKPDMNRHASWRLFAANLVLDCALWWAARPRSQYQRFAESVLLGVLLVSGEAAIGGRLG